MCILSFIEQAFIEYLLCAKQCSRHWGLAKQVKFLPLWYLHSTKKGKKCSSCHRCLYHITHIYTHIYSTYNTHTFVLHSVICIYTPLQVSSQFKVENFPKLNVLQNSLGQTWTPGKIACGVLDLQSVALLARCCYEDHMPWQEWNYESAYPGTLLRRLGSLWFAIFRLR